MCGNDGRAAAHAALLLLVVNTASYVRAQASDEVIVDPELAAQGGASSSADGDEEIVDPELSSGNPRPESSTANVPDNGWGNEAAAVFNGGPREAAAPVAEEDTHDPMANTGLAKIEVVGQQGVDIHRENYLEDFFESRLRFGAETDFRVSRKLRLATGARLDFFYAAPNPNDSDLKAEGKSASDVDRYEVDIIPLSAYVDYTVADGVHLRGGVQPISLGRMDFFSPTDMLAVYDLRASPKSDPSSMRLAQPAVKVDWDISSWATLQVAYIPWFMPHFSRPNQDRFVGAATSGIGASRQENPYQWMLPSSNQPLFTQSTLRLAGPAPDFTHPQAEARLNMRGSSYEIAVLGGTALEKTPFVYYAPEVAKYLAYASFQNDGSANAQTYLNTRNNVAAHLSDNLPVADIAYPRYYLLGLDGSVDIAPITIGFEAAYSPSRNLYTTSRDGSMPALPNVSHEIVDPVDGTGNARVDKDGKVDFTNTARDKSIRKGVQVVQGALHVEWIKEDQFAVVAEAYIIQALQMPYDRSRDWLGFIKGTGTTAGGILGGTYRFGADRWRISASVALLPGVSVIAMPQLEMRASDSVYVNLGAQFYEGPAPGNIPLPMGGAPKNAFATNLTAGGVFSGYDQVTLGFRWLPGN